MRFLCRDIIAAAVVCMCCLSASADENNFDDDSSVERIRFIQSSLEEESFSAQLWWGGWAGFNAAVGIVSFTDAALTHNRTTKITQTVSGIESTMGFAGLLMTPMPAAYAPRLLRSMPESSLAERRNKLTRAEEWLDESGENESFGRSWINHAMTFAVTAGGGLVIWKGYGSQISRSGGDPLREGLISFLSGFAVGEIQIFTQPVRSIGSRERYRSRYGSSDGTEIRFSLVSAGRDIYGAATLLF